ncbi:MAG: hypothetical protein JSW19_02445 [Candidatus Bathyarchaeota archaeon]|nr:MAG: hypothetical protein JSV75_04745 [Candidatus Bathyarchaeota archaeon]UCE57244.1 MAG: hypothetical protein JSW19_02445 [Candidatus Bathyarchaeota archaeon]
MAQTIRPIGVSVLAVLVALAGILALIGAVVLGVVAGTMTEFIESMIVEYGGLVIPDVSGFFQGMLLVIAAVVAVVGILALVDAYGLWVGAGWAWWLTIILSALGIIGGIVSLPGGIVAIFIDALIIYYFTRSYVKEFFGI